MSSDQELSDLIGEIYDCAIDQGLWTSTLPHIAEFISTRTALINVVCPVPEPGRRPIRSLFDCGLPEHSAEAYVKKYADIDPMIHAGALYGVDEVFTAREAVGDEFWTGSQMYREWNRPFGLTEHLSGIIRKDIVRVGALTVLRQKPFDEVEKEKLKLLLPHLRRSVTIAQLISGKTVERDRFREIVDRLIVAVFLVDSTGLIHHANTAGQQLLTEGKVLRSRNGRLTSLISHEQAALLAAIEAGHKGAPAVALTMRDGTALIATILPLKDGYRLEASYRTKAAAAVFVDNPAGRFEYPGEMICKLFKLTGAELQLLLALLDGVTLQGAAERFGVSLATVKTHLQRIFAKTDTARQAELIRKVGQLMRPVRR